VIAVPTSRLDTRLTPVSLPELKEHLRIDHSDQDRMLQSKLKAAVYEVEAYIGGPVIQRSFTMTLSGFSDEIPLLPGPVLSITSIGYYDANNDSQTLTSADYELARVNGIYRLTAADAWPDTADRVDAVSIVYGAGLAESVLDVPFDVKEAITIRAATRYSVSEESGPGTVTWNIKGDLSVEMLLNPYRLLQC